MYSEMFKINIIKARLHHRETVSGPVKKSVIGAFIIQFY